MKLETQYRKVNWKWKKIKYEGRQKNTEGAGTGSGNDFFANITRSQATNTKINNWDYISSSKVSTEQMNKVKQWTRKMFCIPNIQNL